MAIFVHIDNFDITTQVAKISQNQKIMIFFYSTYIGDWKPHSVFSFMHFFNFQPTLIYISSTCFVTNVSQSLMIMASLSKKSNICNFVYLWELLYPENFENYGNIKTFEFWEYLETMEVTETLVTL